MNRKEWKALPEKERNRLRGVVGGLVGGLKRLHRAEPRELTEAEAKPDWSKNCSVCGAKPVIPLTGMCGPCTFGEAETAGGDW